MALSDSTRVVFTGDIAFSQKMANSWIGRECLENEVSDYLCGADYVIGNIESPLTDSVFNRNALHLHASPYAAGGYLSTLNIKIWSIANNHVMDCGNQGLLDTIRCASENQCKTIGANVDEKEASCPLVIGEQVKIGVLSIAKPWEYIISGENKPGALTWKQTQLIRKWVEELKSEVDWIVFVVHGGDEFSDLPMPYVRAHYLELLDLGANIIVGHHPHVVQNYEYIENKLIVYSLGNFIFDTDFQRAFERTDVGVLLGICFEKNDFSMDFLPITINRIAQSVKVGTLPTLFCEINEDEYRRLWPLAAKRFYKVNNRKWLLTQKRFSHSNRLTLMIHNILGYRKKKNWVILKGRILCLFKGWKASKLNNLCEYLQDTID